VQVLGWEALAGLVRVEGPREVSASTLRLLQWSLDVFWNVPDVVAALLKALASVAGALGQETDRGLGAGWDAHAAFRSARRASVMFPWHQGIQVGCCRVSPAVGSGSSVVTEQAWYCASYGSPVLLWPCWSLIERGWC
jgi:hypothetical protein